MGEAHWKGIRNSVSFPSSRFGPLALRRFLRAKAVRCQTRDGDLTKGGLQLHAALSPRRTSALLHFSDSCSETLFFAKRSLLTSLPPHPDHTFSPTIVLESTPFPRLPTLLSLFATPRESSVNVCSRYLDKSGEGRAFTKHVPRFIVRGLFAHCATRHSLSSF